MARPFPSWKEKNSRQGEKRDTVAAGNFSIVKPRLIGKKEERREDMAETRRHYNNHLR
jgi:hypothetical protein